MIDLILQWVFLIVSLFVIIESIIALRTATMDHAVFIGKKIDGGLRTTANINMQMGWFFVTIALLMTLMSILLFLLTPMGKYRALIVGYIMLGVLLVVASLLSKSARHRLTQFSRQEHQETTYVTASPAESGQPLDSPTEGTIVEGRRSSDPKPQPKETP